MGIKIKNLKFNNNGDFKKNSKKRLNIVIYSH